MHKNIVILGAGFGGLRCALDMARTTPKDYKIVLIDRNPYHLYYPKLFEEIVPRSEVSGFRCQVSVLEILKGTKVEFIQGAVQGIDCKGRTVEVTPSDFPLHKGEKWSYEYLVLALGADTDYFGIPGLKEYGCTLKSIKDAETIRVVVQEFLQKKRERLDIVIGGAGATGVEVAAELAYLFRDVPRQQWSITIVEALPRILAMFPNELSQYAHARLEKLGVRLMLDTCIKSVGTKEGKPEIVLAPRPLKPGETEAQLTCDFLPAHEKRVVVDVLLWAGGVRANPFISTCGMLVDRKGRVEVDEHLVVKGIERIFAIGDNALLMDPTTKQPVPATAQAALLQGKIVADNIMRTIKGMPLALYSFPKFPAIVPLADKDAVALIGNHVMRGFLAMLLRKAADVRYYASIVGWWKAMKRCIM